MTRDDAQAKIDDLIKHLVEELLQPEANNLITRVDS